MDKWMTILDMGYVIINWYNFILVYLSSIQNIMIFLLHYTTFWYKMTSTNQYKTCSWFPFCEGKVIIISTIIKWVLYTNFIFTCSLQEVCPLSMVNIILFTHCYFETKAWLSFYVSRMQTFVEFMNINTSYVDLH